MIHRRHYCNDEHLALYSMFQKSLPYRPNYPHGKAINLNIKALKCGEK